jgi:predicted nucleic acid-binding protein
LILLDTGVLSAVLRRRRRGNREERLAAQVTELLESDEEIALPGIVFQEILSGIAEAAHFEKVLGSVRESFPIVLAIEGDHEEAAKLANTAARRGVAVSAPDALIAAQAVRVGATLFTVDPDLVRIASFAGLRLLAS